MNTLKFNQFTLTYTITIQPEGFAFPYTYKINTFKAALYIIAEIKAAYNITITI